MSVRSVPGVFTAGSTLRHVLVMTATGALGFVALFLVDALSLFYIGLLGDPTLTAAVGFASVVLFVIISVSIGVAIGAAALCSRAIGAGETEKARTVAGSSLVHAAAAMAVTAVAVLVLRQPILALLGAEGHAAEAAARYLAITLPTMPLLGIGMALSAILRAAGAARAAMYVTLSGGLVAAVCDPLFIFGFGLGLDGAAIAAAVSRAGYAFVGYWLAVHDRDLVAMPSLSTAGADARPLWAIALPAVLTNLAAPVATGYMLKLVAPYGDPAVAGFAIIDRIVPLAFGTLFALAGAVGPILGQNYGARRFDRVRRSLTDCFLVSGVYALIVWGLMALGAELIAAAFGATGRTAEIVRFYAAWGSGGWVLLGALFVANAAFNTLGFQLLALAFNWGRATLGVIPFTTLGAAYAGPEGVILGFAAGAAVFGLLSVVAAYRVVARLERREALSVALRSRSAAA